MFNSLHIIKSLIRTDQDKAAECLEDFSDYLRANIDAIASDNLISSQPAVNIIFVTGYQEYAVEAHELYCSAFLLKPVGRRKLKTAFENLRKPFMDIPSEFYSQHYSGGAVIGKRIAMCREQRGISRQELAEYMKVTRQTVYRWEQGERIPDVLTFIRLTRLLGIDLEDILKI